MPGREGRHNTPNPENPLPADLLKRWKKVHEAKGPRAKTASLAFSFYEKDVEMVTWLAEYLGCNRSEAVRTAVRSMCAHIGFLEGKRS